MRIALEPLTYAYGVDLFFYGACTQGFGGPRVPCWRDRNTCCC